MSKVPTIDEASWVLHRGLDYLEQTERERCPCTCGLDAPLKPGEIRNPDAEHSLDCPAFARADVGSMRAALERLCRESLRMEKVDAALERLCRESLRMEKVDEGFKALCELGVLS